jgi:hypothetical protein
VALGKEVDRTADKIGRWQNPTTDRRSPRPRSKRRRRAFCSCARLSAPSR